MILLSNQSNVSGKHFRWVRLPELHRVETALLKVQPNMFFFLFNFDADQSAAIYCHELIFLTIDRSQTLLQATGW
jgi:hypothetical protein